jgi:uncharacterized protein (DUF1697 family)
MPPAPRATTWLALLRGVNVGGKNKLPMRELVALFEAEGCTEVAHYIQSGNVVFRAAPPLAARMGEAIAAAIEAKFGIVAPVITRSAAELRTAVDENPFPRAGVDVATLHVGFLAEAPSPRALASLDPARSPPDRFEVRGREIFLALPNGVARSKLTNAYFDSKLATTSTFRNWRTVLTLLEMVKG